MFRYTSGAISHFLHSFVATGFWKTTRTHSARITSAKFLFLSAGRCMSWDGECRSFFTRSWAVLSTVISRKKKATSFGRHSKQSSLGQSSHSHGAMLHLRTSWRGGKFSTMRMREFFFSDAQPYKCRYLCVPEVLIHCGRSFRVGFLLIRFLFDISVGMFCRIRS